MARLIDKYGITVVVGDAQAERLEAIGYKKADEPKPKPKRTTKTKEQ